MVNIEKLKRELRKRYIKDRAILCCIEVFTSEILSGEILIILEEPSFTITKIFKKDTAIEDIFQTIDKSIYREDYKYSYFKLKEFWIEHKIDFIALEEILNDESSLVPIFELKEDEKLIGLGEYVFSVSFDDAKLKYQIGKINKVTVVDNTVSFTNCEFDKNVNEVENGVNRLQIIRKELKKERL